MPRILSEPLDPERDFVGCERFSLIDFSGPFAEMQPKLKQLNIAIKEMCFFIVGVS